MEQEVPDDESLNDMIARSEEELDLFQVSSTLTLTHSHAVNSQSMNIFVIMSHDSFYTINSLLVYCGM